MSYAGTQVAQIAAISRNRCIGKDNALPWHISADLQHFKQLTTSDNDHADGMSGIVIMGRKTFESMGSKPLPKRVCFIITSDMDYAKTHALDMRPYVHVMHNLDDALTSAASLAHGMHLDTVWVIGGERVFRDALRYTDRVELTLVDTDIEDGDAFYPELPPAFSTAEESAEQHDDNSNLSYRFVRYERSASA
ncbi:dihydrofolate reductase [Psychrobacter aestuarii]|uniref:Dihydrofolate reductase n=1 Tax=Psychrobacter aestuarii TaxID=556327 RepID=A0ABP3FPJ4_9GAMM|nr:dihydrofolate reductase [Psychrobacter aestuarii]